MVFHFSDMSNLENNAHINKLMLFSTARKLNTVMHLFSIKTDLANCKEAVINPIQAGGGHNVPPCRFLPCCAKTVCSRLMKLSDF